jgi:hypothetical protein
MNPSLSWILLIVGGGLLCFVNFYLSFLRYPLHRLRGLPRSSYRWVSGIPLLGSLLVAISLVHFHSMASIMLPAIALIVIDTGGIHWFLGSMIYHSLRGKKNR